MKKGEFFEEEASLYFHKKGVPVLVSGLMLRSYDLGQVDICYLERSQQKSWVLKIIEVKSSVYPGKIQLRRLLKSQDYLSRVLDLESKLEVKFCQKELPSLSF